MQNKDDTNMRLKQIPNSTSTNNSTLSKSATSIAAIAGISSGDYSSCAAGDGASVDVQAIISEAIKSLQSNRVPVPDIASSAIRKQIQNLPELDTSLRSKPMVAKVADAKARALFQSINTDVKKPKPPLHPQKNINTVTVTPVKPTKSPVPSRTPSFFARVRKGIYSAFCFVIFLHFYLISFW